MKEWNYSTYTYTQKKFSVVERNICRVGIKGAPRCACFYNKRLLVVVQRLTNFMNRCMLSSLGTYMQPTILTSAHLLRQFLEDWKYLSNDWPPGLFVYNMMTLQSY